MNRSGGLTYHTRALAFKRGLWNSFRRELHEILSRKLKEAHSLLLIGPSAGYTLDDELLKNRKQIWISEPDPLARWILGRRLQRINQEHLLMDADFMDPAGGFWRLRDFAHDRPGLAVVFCNLLGQMPFVRQELLDPIEQQRYWANLENALKDFHWVSYHDAISFEGSPGLSKLGFSHDRSLLPAELLKKTLSHWNARIDGDVIDHGTWEFAPKTPRDYLIWRLSPQRLHVIEVAECKSKPWS